MEFLDACAGAPAAFEGARAPGLARVGEPGLDLSLQHRADVDLEGGRWPGEAPSLLRLVRPAGVEGHAADHPVVRMEAVGNVRVEGQHQVRTGLADLPDELLPELERFHELCVGMAKKRDTADPEQGRRGLCLSLTDPSHFGARFRLIAGALVA